MSEIVKSNNGELAAVGGDRGVHVAGDFTKYSPDQRAQLRALGGLDEASDGDLDMLAAFSDRTGLDPFVKEVYLVGRRTKTVGYRGEPERWETKWSVQTGIDGFRKVTHRVASGVGEPVSIGRPVYYDAEGMQRPIWLKAWGFPAAAEVEVRIGDSVGVGIATWDEYVQTKRDGKPNSMWEKMGPTMLAKCAEAQAHRRVTPLTAGMYVDEEMMQADRPLRMSASREAAAGGNRGMDVVREQLAARSAPAAAISAPQTVETEAAPVDDPVASPEPGLSEDEVAELESALVAIEECETEEALRDLSAAFKDAGWPEHLYARVRAAGNDRFDQLKGGA